MKIAAAIARYLLGFMFTVFGLNGFFHFMPQGQPPTPLAGQFMQVISASHYMVPVFVCQLISGVLLLIGRFVPLALVILAAIIVNILTFHATMDMKDIGPGLLTAVLWVVVFVRYRESFRPLFRSQAEPSGR